jgi:type IV fimbrial biogenesis protein FimT
MLSRFSQQACVRGFTLIELLTVMAIVAIVAAFAVPSMQQQLASFRVRAAADGIVSGLNLARAEAVRRNSPVALTLAAGGSGWSVSRVSPSAVIRSRGGGESGIDVASNTTSRTVTFLPTGLVDVSTARLEQATVSSQISGASTRQINILGGGLVRMCDPSVVTANDPRAC